MTRILLALLLFVGGTGMGRAEYLRGDDGNPLVGSDGNLTHITKLEAACGPALQRFCPDLTIAPGQTRNEAICLKPFRANLASSCRALVGAVKN